LNFCYFFNLSITNLYNLFLVFSIVISSSFSIIHFSESKIEIGLVESNLDKIILVITIIGTESNIQTTPQITHHNHKDNKITKGLKLSLDHINFGSIIFQISTCMNTKIPININKLILNQNCNNAKIEITETAIIEPTVGIKFNIKIMNDQNNAKSTLKYINIKYVNTHVIKEVIVFIKKYHFTSFFIFSIIELILDFLIGFEIIKSIFTLKNLYSSKINKI
jgi:hypothetical protein